MPVVNVGLLAASGVAPFADPGAPQVLSLDLSPGNTIVIVGANGSGKSRLGAMIESQTEPASHRIPAQRSVAMADKITLTDLKTSMTQLFSGGPSEQHTRHLHRWGNQPAIHPVDDFQFVMQALFAQQNRILIDEHRLRQSGAERPVPVTMLDRLQRIWEQLLTHRKLKILDASIQAEIPAGPYHSGDGRYLASQMSDGERVIFYLIGQTLLAPKQGVIVIDEPELHIHPSLSSILWDTLESERPDLAFAYVTHDVEFAASRVLAKKYFVRSILAGTFWDIQEIPEDTGLPQEVVIELLGNRKPVLFVEGEAGSIDTLIYRSVFPLMQVEPRGSCDAVIQSVASFKANSTLHRLGAVFGCVDADHRSRSMEMALEAKGVYPLCVAEIENVFLLPDVFLALADALAIPKKQAAAALASLQENVFKRAEIEHDAVVGRFISREIDRQLKVVTVDKRDLSKIKVSFDAAIASIDVERQISEFSAFFKKLIADREYERLLWAFDQKGMLGLAAAELSLGSGKNLVQQAARFAVDSRHAAFKQALLAQLPRFN